MPTLLVGVLLLFLLRQLGPGESKWEERLETEAQSQGSYSPAKLEQAKTALRRRLHLDLPVFYWSVRGQGLPTEEQVLAFTPNQRQWVSRLAALSGVPEQAVALAVLMKQEGWANWDSSGDLPQLLSRVRNQCFDRPEQKCEKVQLLLAKIEADASPWRSYVPRLSWNGAGNQFHYWIEGMLRADFGNSWKNDEKVAQVVGRSLTYSLRVTLPAFILIFVAAYWLVLWLSKLGPRAKHLADQLLYLLDLFPLFGWSILLMVLFASGLVFSWFPSYVAGREFTATDFLSGHVWPYVLPVAALWLASVPYVTKHIDQSFQKTAHLGFVSAAHARGLPPLMVKKKYRLRYSLLPGITLLGEYMLAVLGGAMVVEVLFSIPGIGKLMADSVQAQDFPVVTAVVLLLLFTRMCSYLLTDLLYYWFDPRIRVVP